MRGGCRTRRDDFYSRYGYKVTTYLAEAQLKTGIAGLLRVGVGMAFLVLALMKVYSFKDGEFAVSAAFELYLVNQTPLTERAHAAVASRALIWVELVLGGLLLFRYGARHVAVATIALLVVFTGYLFTQIGSPDCGCFGDHAQITPCMSALKNLVMIGMLVPSVLCVSLPRLCLKRTSGVAALSLLLVTAGMPISRPAPVPDEGTNPEILAVQAYLSMDCEHCQEAAMMLAALEADLAPAEVVFYLLGTEEQLPEFLGITGSEQVRHQIIDDAVFWSHIESAPPRIELRRGAELLAGWNQDELSSDVLYEAIEQAVLTGAREE